MKKKNDNYLVNKGITITFITNFIDFQTNLLSRENSDRQSIENTVKTVFNEMMNNGDIEYGDWGIIEDKLKKVRYQTKDELLKDIKKEHIINMMSDVCFNCRDTKGRSIEDTISVESISSFSKENKVSKTMSELFALLKYKKEIELELEKKLEVIEEMKLEETMSSMINKYGKMLPEKYIKGIGVVFDETRDK